MRNFAAIDFETANNERTSVCSVGVVIVRDGEIVDSFYSLIQPEPNYYNYWCTQVHGLTRQDTEDAPVLPEKFYKTSFKYVTFSFFAYYINKKKYLCKRIKLYEKRSDCNLQRREQLHST